MAHPNDELIRRFYAAFTAGDGVGMAACYTPDVRFSDPVFPDLRGYRAGAMWQMLTSGDADVRIELLECEAGDERGTAHWQADYEFSQTSRKVHNDVHAEFKFRDGLIAEHRDSFSFHRWSSQALGPAGVLLGWTPIVRGGVQRKAAARLDEFVKDHPETTATS
jgi:uncharacterized protein